MTTIDPRDAALDAAIASPHDRAHGEPLRILAAQVRELRAAMPKRGTWSGEVWLCDCGKAPDHVNSATIAICGLCGTLRPPLPAAATPQPVECAGCALVRREGAGRCEAHGVPQPVAKVGTWRTDGDWDCGCPAHESATPTTWTTCGSCFWRRPPLLARVSMVGTWLDGGHEHWACACLDQSWSKFTPYCETCGTHAPDFPKPTPAPVAAPGVDVAAVVKRMREVALAAHPQTHMVKTDDVLAVCDAYDNVENALDKLRASWLQGGTDRDSLRARLETAERERDEAKRAYADNDANWIKRKANAEAEYKVVYDRHVAEIANLAKERDEAICGHAIAQTPQQSGEVVREIHRLTELAGQRKAHINRIERNAVRIERERDDMFAELTTLRARVAWLVEEKAASVQGRSSENTTKEIP